MLPGLRGWPFIFAFFLAVVLVLGTHLKGVMADDGAAAPFLVKFEIAGSNVPEGASLKIPAQGRAELGPTRRQALPRACRSKVL